MMAKALLPFSIKPCDQHANYAAALIQVKQLPEGAVLGAPSLAALQIIGRAKE